MNLSFRTILCFPLALLLGGCVSSGSPTPESPRAATTPAAWPTDARVVELSHPLSEEIPVFPGGTRLSRNVLGTVERDGYLISNFTVGEHTGTHVDAPAHFVAGAATVDQLAPESLAGPAAVVDVSAKVAQNPDYEVTQEDILDWERQHGALQPHHLVLFNTGWNARWLNEKQYRNADAEGKMHFPGVSVAASQLLRARKVRAIGIDTLSTDPGPSASFEEHKDFLAGGGYHIENLANLSALPPAGAFVVVAPLGLKGGSGAPARVLAFLPSTPR